MSGPRGFARGSAAVAVLASFQAELFVVRGEEVVDLVRLANVVQVVDAGRVGRRADGCQSRIADRRRRETAEAARVVRRVTREMRLRQRSRARDPQAVPQGCVDPERHVAVEAGVGYFPGEGAGFRGGPPPPPPPGRPPPPPWGT